MTDNENELLELRETVRLLMAENDLLAERAEDTLLLGLIAEQINLTSDASQLVSVALEQISLLKNLPACIHCLVLDEQAVIQAAYMNFSDQVVSGMAVPFLPALKSALSGGTMVFHGQAAVESAPVRAWFEALQGMGFQAETLMLVPFEEQSSGYGFFLFADDQPEERLTEMALLLNRVVEMVVDRRNKLYLVQALNRSNLQLQATVSELEAFSYSVSHDLRAPLRVVNGFAAIILESYANQLPEEARDYLLRIQESTRLMGRLIDGLLQFSRLGRKQLVREPVDLRGLFQQAWVDLRQEYEGRAIELVMDALPPCQGDELLLRQVCANLLSNAVKFTRTRPEARVEVGYMHGTVPGAPLDGLTGAYYVRDNGVGFDPRYAEKLFGVFQRLHRDEEFEGTGVGLAIVNRILLRHGGAIWAESVLDQGATFYFVIEQPAGCRRRFGSSARIY